MVAVYISQLSVLPHSGQVCYIHLILEEFDQNTAQLIPHIIKMESELELSTYTISQWNLVNFEEGKIANKKGSGS